MAMIEEIIKGRTGEKILFEMLENADACLYDDRRHCCEDRRSFLGGPRKRLMTMIILGKERDRFDSIFVLIDGFDQDKGECAQKKGPSTSNGLLIVSSGRGRNFCKSFSSRSHPGKERGRDEDTKRVRERT
jgi:hypothetical protein